MENPKEKDLLAEIEMLKKENESLKNAFLQDENELLRNEDLLSNNNSTLELAMQTANMAWWEMDITTGNVIFNKRKAEMLGYPTDIFKHYSDFMKLVHPDDYEKAMDSMRKHIEGLLDKYEIIYRIQTEKGTYKWFHDVGVLVRNEQNGKPVKVIGIVIDISERKLSEEKIKENEEKFRLLIENSHDIIYMLSSEGIFTYVSPAWSKLLGHPADQVEGKAFQNFVHNDDLPQCLEFLQKVIETGERQEGVEYRVRHRDGSWFWHTSSGVPFKNANGKIIGFEGIARDITEQKLAKLALQQSETKFRTLYNSTSDAVMLLDEKGFFDCNTAALNIFGISSVEEFLKIHPEDVSPEFQPSGEDSMTLANLQIKTAMEKGSLSFEWIHKRADTGESFPAEVLLNRMELDGKPVLQAVVRDITKRKRAEDALRENEEYLSNIFNIIGTGIVLVNSENHKILAINKTGSELIGLPADDIIGQTCRKFICYDNQGACPVKDLHYKVDHSERKLISVDGTIKDIVKTVFPMKYKGANCHLESFMDITELKSKEIELEKLNEELVESKDIIEANLYQKNALIHELEESETKLKEIVSEKDKFFSIIAHDLKSPFSGFLGLTKILAEQVQDLSMSEMKDFSKKMKESADNLYALLENLLEWSRMQRGKTEFNPEMCILLFLVKQNLDIAGEFAKQKNINLINKIPENTYLNADLPMLNTVFRNLISNAIKFTPRGGNIEVGIKATELPEICMYVKDSGIGMNKEILSKLFQLNSKVSRKGTENEPSTGLGLLLCKEFIEKHGGRIWVESEEGKGTTFYFTIPS